ncbi:MAG: DNA-formamidopyrimidine glycosylase, partial [Bacilli bacterium]|nr:DNA-formamidopyrimidine glycosylase [Bacilli bacterium]
MPELPEVETVVRGLREKVVGRIIRKVNIYYENIIEYPDICSFQEKIKNQKINEVNRYGKWIIFVLDNYYLLSHLRMEGKYFLKPKGTTLEKHEHVSFVLDNDMELRYMDVRKFGKMQLIEKENINKIGPFLEMGLEPWDKKLNTLYLKEKFLRKKLPIKSCLLDQRIIVGIGNIYADEILFRSKIHPKSFCDALTSIKLKKIIENTKIVFEESLKCKGTYPNIDGKRGTYEEHLLVHKREKQPCFNCGNIIK